jgi:hypothetical protein
MAYPSEEFKNNGYAYIETFCIKDRGLSNIDEKLHRIGDAMAKDLQKFIDSKKYLFATLKDPSIKLHGEEVQ